MQTLIKKLSLDHYLLATSTKRVARDKAGAHANGQHWAQYARTGDSAKHHQAREFDRTAWLAENGCDWVIFRVQSAQGSLMGENGCKYGYVHAHHNQH